MVTLHPPTFLLIKMHALQSNWLLTI